MADFLSQPAGDSFGPEKFNEESGPRELTVPPTPKDPGDDQGIRFNMVDPGTMPPGITCQHYVFYTKFIFDPALLGRLRVHHFAYDNPRIAVVWPNDPNQSDITKDVFERSVPSSTLSKPAKGIAVEDHRTFRAWVFRNYRDGGKHDMGAWQMNHSNASGDPRDIRVNIGLDFSTTEATARSGRTPPGGFLDTVTAPEKASGNLGLLRNGVKIERYGALMRPMCSKCQGSSKTPCKKSDSFLRCQWCTFLGSKCVFPKEGSMMMAFNSSEAESCPTTDEDEDDDRRNRANSKGKDKTPAKTPAGKSSAGTKSATKQPGGSTKASTDKTKQRPKARVSEGGSFYPSFDSEETERSMFDHGKGYIEIDSDGDIDVPSPSRYRFSSSNSMELDDSDKFQGNKGPAMPPMASQDDQPNYAMSSQVTSSQLENHIRKSLDPQNMSFGTFIRKSTSQPDKLGLEEYIELDAASTVMPGATKAEEQSKVRDTSPEDARMGFDGAGDTPPRARRSARFGSFNVQGELEELNISGSKWHKW